MGPPFTRREGLSTDPGITWGTAPDFGDHTSASPAPVREESRQEGIFPTKKMRAGIWVFNWGSEYPHPTA